MLALRWMQVVDVSLMIRNSAFTVFCSLPDQVNISLPVSVFFLLDGSPMMAQAQAARCLARRDPGKGIIVNPNPRL